MKLKLYKGNMINAGVTSPFTLYDEQTASFGVDKDYDQSDATGFINLFGLSIKERAKLQELVQELAGGQVTAIFSDFGVCFHTFTRGFHTGIVAGGTAAGAFSPAAALPFL